MISALIVDDWAVMRKLIVQTLMSTTYKPNIVTEASDGVDALQKFKEKSGINLILSDWNMPHMDGLTFITKIREKDKNAIIVMITTENGMDKMEEAIKRGANGFITKPFTAEDMQRRLQLAYSGKNP